MLALPPFLRVHRILTAVVFFFTIQAVSAEVAVNDSRANAFGIYDTGFFPANNQGATSEKDELIHGGVGTGHSLWWYFQESHPYGYSDWVGQYQLTLRPYEPGVSFVLIVYKVDPEGKLVEQAKVQAEDMTPQSVRFELESDAEYEIAVDSTSEETGWFYFAINQAPEIHAPLSISYTANEIISIPVHIAGYPDPNSIELTEGQEYFSYDPTGKQIIGSLPSYDSEGRVGIRGQNEFGEHAVMISLFLQDSDYALTSPASALGLVGVPFEYALEFEGAPGFQPENLQVNHLPDGLSLVHERGKWKIKGVPRNANDYWVSLDYENQVDWFTAELKLEIIDYTQAELVPEITSPLMAYATVGVPFSYQLETSLPVEEFDALSLPDGLSLNTATGLISGTPLSNYNDKVSVRAVFPGGEIEGELKLVFVENNQQVIEFQVPPILYAYEGVPFEYAVKTSAPVEFFDATLPAGLEIDPDTGFISGIPEYQEEFHGDLYANNPGIGENPQMSLDFHVLAAQPLQRVTSPVQVMGVRGEFFEYQLEAEPLALTPESNVLFDLPPGLSFDSATRKIVGVPVEGGLQSTYLQLDNNEFGLQFHFVEPFARPEFLSPASAFAEANNFFYYAFSAPGAESYQISEVIERGLPDGLSFDTSTGVISGMPLEEGTFILIVRAYKNNTYSDTCLRLTVSSESGANAPLIISPGQMVGEVGELIVYQISSNDASGNLYNVRGLPSGFQFDSSMGIIYGSSPNRLGRTITVEHGAARAEVLLQVYEPQSGVTPLMVTGPPSALGEPGQWFEFQIETNADEISAEIFEFRPDLSWPEGLTLNPNTGRVSGYLGEDWPPQLGYNISSSAGDTESVLTIVDASTGRPPVIESDGHIMAYEGDYIEYVFDLADPTADLQINGFSTGLQNTLQYDPEERKLFGNLGPAGQGLVQFEVIDANDPSLWAVGELDFQVLDAGERPEPIVTSELAPVAETGELFRYKFEFNQADALLTWVDTGEDWLRQTGPLEISGYVPEGYGGHDLQINFDYENSDAAHGSAELRIQVSEPREPVVVTSAASATAYEGLPFRYELKVEPMRLDNFIDVHALPEWMSYDPETRVFSGIPNDFGNEYIDITVDTPSGHYSSMVHVLTAQRQLRPLISGYTPAPAFLNVPFVLPFSIEGAYDDFSYSINEVFAVDPALSALTGVPNDDQGGFHGDFEVSNPDGSSRVDFEIRQYDSAPVILEDPRSMVSFLGGMAYFKARSGGQANLTHWFKDNSSPIADGESLELHDLGTGDQGDYSFRVENQMGEAVSQVARLTVGTPARLRDWTIAHVGAEVDSRPGGEPNESWSNDGVSNVMKWAMGLPLLDRTSEPLVGGYHSEGALHIEFMRNADAADVTLVVERSETLAESSWEPIVRRLAGGSWQLLRPSASVRESGSSRLRTVEVRDSRISDCGFLRVRVMLESEALQTP